MDGIKAGNELEDMGDGMTCSDHPYTNNPGGICAFCLQEKLGKLVSSSSSSFPLPIRASASSSSDSPPPFRSDISSTTTNVNSLAASISLSRGPYGECYSRKARVPFLMTSKKKIMASSTTSSSNAALFKRSKSTTTPRRKEHFLDADECEDQDFSSRKKGSFWSFLNMSSKKTDKGSRNTRNIVTTAAIATNGSLKGKEKCIEASSSSLSKKVVILEDEDDSPNSQATASASSFERKVSRSRSVGCGSRSFSGDFFERISNGFGDCTLRRVESQREGKAKASGLHSQHCMKERVKCGGIFGGFIMNSSSSSSSSSSYLVSSAEDMSGKSAAAAAGTLVHGRSRSWGWAFASPMRAFSKPSSKKDVTNNSNNKTTPNLDAIPSLLAVKS